jgi:hypothetical protein
MLALVVVIPSAAHAQQSVSDVLGFLITSQSIQTGSLDRDQAAALATRETISQALLANLATLPVSTSSGPFVYRLNPELGTVERATRSFGPFFVERATTAGAGAGLVGVTFQHFRFTSLDGHNLRDGTLVTVANRFVDEPEPFDVDHLTLDLNADVATVYTNIGITDRAEVGVAVPIVMLRLRGSRANVYRGRTFTQATASATALGFADTIVHTKFVLGRSEDSAVAAAADLRLPTGREGDLLGVGSTALKLSGIVSTEQGPVSTHLNGAWTTGGFARELSYGGAVAIVTGNRLTWTAEMLGRSIATGGRIGPVAAPHPTLRGAETIRLQPQADSLHILTFMPGVKWNVGDTWVFAASFGIPLTNAGLTAPLTQFAGLDYGMQW